jgi:hypothetical protein
MNTSRRSALLTASLATAGLALSRASLTAAESPGLQLITAADLKNFWRSDYYGAKANAVLSRPAFVIDRL